MQGYVYTKDNNRTKEAVVVDKNSGKTIALSSFSDYMAFSGGTISEWMKTVAETAKGVARELLLVKYFNNLKVSLWN